MKRRFLSVLLSLCMLLGVLPTAALGAEETVGETQVETLPVELPEEAAGEIPEDASEEKSEETSEETPEETPGETTGETPEEAPEEKSEETPEETPEEKSEETSEETPEETSEETPEEKSEETPEETSGEKPEEVPAEVPEVLSAEVPEGAAALEEPPAEELGDLSFGEIQSAFDGAAVTDSRFLAVTDEAGVIHITLYGDVTYNAGKKDKSTITVAKGRSVALDLNGHRMTLNQGMEILDYEANVAMPDGGAPVTGAVITVAAGGSLTLTDTSSGQDGMITGAYDNGYTVGGVRVSGGSFVMNGGTISGNVACRGAGVSVFNGGSFVMNGGLIAGNVAFQGGGVCVSGANSCFTMKGGVIADNAAAWGGGVFAWIRGTLELESGEICRNYAYPINHLGDQEGYGGGVMGHSNSVVNLGGVVIRDNETNGWGGGVFFQGATVTMKNTVIEGNAARLGASAMNVSSGTVDMEDVALVGVISCKNAEVTHMNSLRREGHVFYGWYDIYDGTRYGEDTIPAGDPIELEAVWECRHSHSDSGFCLEEDCDHDETCCPRPPAVKTLAVTWYDEDGTTLLDAGTFPEGEAEPAYAGKTPAKAEDADNRYTFKGWTRTVDEEGNVTYRAGYTAVPKGGGSSDDDSGSDDTPAPRREQVVLEEREVPLVQAPATGRVAYITGFSDGTVRPEAYITRAEVVTIFFRLMTEEGREIDRGEAVGFPDVLPESWYYDAVSAAAGAGLINGLPDGTFGGERVITRGELAAIAARFLGETAQPEEDDAGEGHWARRELRQAVAAGWFPGLEGAWIDPEAKVTRAEVMALVNRMTGRTVDEGLVWDDKITWPDNPEEAWYHTDVQQATNDAKTA